MSQFSPGEIVEIIHGELKGFRGEVFEFNADEDAYLVLVPQVSSIHYYAVPEEMMTAATPEVTPDHNAIVPKFGMTGVRVAAYAGEFLEASMGRLIEEGDRDFQHQGFQGWEGEDPESTLDLMLESLEIFATDITRLHILISRMRDAVGGLKLPTGSLDA